MPTKMIKKKIKANIKNKGNKQQQQQRDLNGRAYTVEKAWSQRIEGNIIE